MKHHNNPTADSATIDVALVSLPWAPATEPLLGLSILKSCLTEKGVSSRVFHMPPSLLRWCTIETYTFLAEMWGVNEFLFSGIISREIDHRQETVLIDRCRAYADATNNPRYADGESVRNLILHVREQIVPEFIRVAVQEVLPFKPKLLGLSCMFDQTIASVAFARAIKNADPTIQIVLGGYALFGDPGKTVATAFPWIDLVVNGDGEQVIVELAESVLSEGSLRQDRRFGNRKVYTAPNVPLEKIPHPDYDDWFEEIGVLGENYKITINTKALPVESSRGCWWGARHHCIFCGIDEETLKYRQKSPERTLEMLHTVREKYGDYIFRFSDYIMPHSYHKTLLPTLADQAERYRLHTEIKANLTRDQVELLARAGFREIQPGIESFLTPVLKAMDKGVTGIANVSLLKFGYLAKIIVNYNILYGLPNDDPELYRTLLTKVPSLYHLMPPVTCSDTAITRFAPLQANPQKFGIDNENHRRHHNCYDVIFSEAFRQSSGFDLDDYGYYFEWGFKYGDTLSTLYSQLCQQVEHWKALHKSRFVELSFEEEEHGLSFRDSRFGDTEKFVLSPAAAHIYCSCDDRPIRADKIQRNSAMFASSGGDELFAQGLEELQARRVVWSEDELIFGLAVPREYAARHAATAWQREWISPWM
jgi:ribosomal peptide maturation radical SAM protein 1